MKARKRNDGFCFVPLRVPRDCNVNQTINKTQHTGSTTSREIRTPVITFPMLPEETRVSIIQCVLNDCGLFYQPYKLYCETPWGEREKKERTQNTTPKNLLSSCDWKLWMQKLSSCHVKKKVVLPYLFAWFKKQPKFLLNDVLFTTALQMHQYTYLIHRIRADVNNHFLKYIKRQMHNSRSSDHKNGYTPLWTKTFDDAFCCNFPKPCQDIK